jgi:hypothetical protein
LFGDGSSDRHLIPVPQLIESKDLEWRGRSFARSDSAMLRLPAAGKKSKPGLAGELDAAVEAMKRVPWTTLEEMKGDAELLKKIDDAQALSQTIAPDIVVIEVRARGVAFMIRDFRFDEGVRRNFSEATVKTLKVFPKMLGSLEGLLHNYHKDNSAGLVERSPLPLENLNASGRQMAINRTAPAVRGAREEWR